MLSLSQLLLLLLGWLAIGLAVPVTKDSGYTEDLQNKEDIIDFLRNVTLLRNVSDDKLAQIADIAQGKYFPTGTNIGTERHIGTLFIKGGQVNVSQKSDGRSQVLGTKRFGDSIIQPKQHDGNTVSLIAETDVQALSVDNNALRQIVGDLSELQGGY